jgi:hypothetical protein
VVKVEEKNKMKPIKTRYTKVNINYYKTININSGMTTDTTTTLEPGIIYVPWQFSI